MTDRPRYADKAARDKMYRTTNWTPLIGELCAALDYLDARLQEAVAREVARDAKYDEAWANLNRDKPWEFPWYMTCARRAMEQARALRSDAAREILEKARNYGALGDESVLKLLVAERDSLRADAEKWRNHRCLQAREALQRENAALREELATMRESAVGRTDAAK